VAYRCQAHLVAQIDAPAGANTGGVARATIRKRMIQPRTLRALGFAILSRTAYRRLIVLERPLNANVPQLKARIPVTIDLLQPDEVAEYVRFHPGLTVAEVQRRLSTGHWCFVVRHAGAMVHAGWAVAGRAWIEYLDCELPLGAGEAYQYGSYTDPAYRGRDLAGARVAMMAAWLHGRGYHRVLAAVLPENRTGFRPLEKVGYRPVGWIGVVRCGWWRRRVGVVHRAATQAGRQPTGAELPAYWDQILHAFPRSTPFDPWYAYMQRVYGRLVAAWLPAPGPALKTDLFEEAITPHHVLGELGPGSIGIDWSSEIVQAARKRLGPAYHVVVADLRHIPLRTASVGRILAASSLDHFVDKRDIAVALTELVRVLKPGGTLVVTFDNPHNPVVSLRNHLPFAWLHRIGIVPYYVGATYDRAEALHTLKSLGLRVRAISAVAHAPRAPAIWVAALVARLRRRDVCRLVEWLLDRCEVLERLPTRYRTGYYLVLGAEKAAATPQAS
jgi:SAM-dependent methyltransferase/GNAT superfamily N-acetyltransferase